MRVKLQLVICHDAGHEETVTDVIALNKNHRRIEHLGLTLAESKELLSTIQRLSCAILLRSSGRRCRLASVVRGPSDSTAPHRSAA
jgi:hypothetical protein